VQYILRGQYDAALRQLEGARTTGGSPAEIENLRGLAQMLGGDPATALQSFERALVVQPSLREAQYNRGLAQLQLGHYAKASADFESVWSDEHSPLRGDAAYHNAIALDRAGRADDAEKWLESALRASPELTGARLYIGMLRERRGDLQGAGRAYLDYLNAVPHSPLGPLRFGLAAHRAGRTEVARKYLEQAIAIAPHSPEAIEARKFLVMWE
jgi:tetratricopeptide (TPR) repeat protein